VVCFFFAIHSILEKNQKIIVYVPIFSDIIHYGHYRLIKKACQFGNSIVVGLVVQDVLDHKPIFSLPQRKAAILESPFVDKIIENAPAIVTKEFMKTHQINVIVHGDDFSLEDARIFFPHAVLMGAYRSVPHDKTISTEEIMNKVISLLNRPKEKKRDTGKG